MIDISKIEKIMDLMGKYGIDVIQAEEGGEKIGLARNGAQLPSSAQVMSSSQMPQQNLAASATSMPSAPISATRSDEAAKPAAQKIPDGVTLKSPFVGTFYRTPSPDSKAFVELGTRVRKGQTLCIVEAMKIMNEIESEVDGEIVAILAENAKPVEFGTPLFVIKP